MKQQAIIVFLSILLFACNRKTTQTATTVENVKVETPAEMEKEDTPAEMPASPLPKPMPETVEKTYVLASIEKTPCYGKCPVFKARFYSDNTVVYYGRKFVDKEGYYEARVSDKMLKEITAKAKSIDYQKLSDSYPADGRFIMDIPNTIVSINMDGHKKEITDNHDAPEKLKEYEQYLVKLLDTLVWKKMDETKITDDK